VVKTFVFMMVVWEVTGNGRNVSYVTTSINPFGFQQESVSVRKIIIQSGP
jgi:hypothetical protein